MKQLAALREAKGRPWYRSDMYLNRWREASGTRYCFLTVFDILGWGFSWEEALIDADRQYRRRNNYVE